MRNVQQFAVAINNADVINKLSVDEWNRNDIASPVLVVDGNVSPI